MIWNRTWYVDEKKRKTWDSGDLEFIQWNRGFWALAFLRRNFVSVVDCFINLMIIYIWNVLSLRQNVPGSYDHKFFSKLGHERRAESFCFFFFYSVLYLKSMDKFDSDKSWYVIFLSWDIDDLLFVFNILRKNRFNSFIV